MQLSLYFILLILGLIISIILGSIIHPITVLLYSIIIFGVGLRMYDKINNDKINKLLKK